MKNYRKFALTAALVLILVWWAALKLDMFGTVMVTMPAFIFFFISFILASIRIIAEKEIKHNLVIMGASVLLGFSLIVPTKFANRGLYELTAKRKLTMQELRPVFIQYRQDHGTFPPALENLVPDYITEIPAELISDGSEDPYRRIDYTLQEEEKAIFVFHTIRGPDSAAVYHIKENRFWYEP